MKVYTNVSRKTVGEDRVAICPNFGCEFMTRIKPLKLRFLGFGKHPKCKKHRIPLVYVNERIGDFVDAALACLFDKAGLPPSELLVDVKSKFPDEVTSFVEGWVYCITVGRGAPIVSRYMDAISNAYLKHLTKKQIKALKKGDNSKPNLVNKAIKVGMDEITIQYTRILKHLRAHSEILVEPQRLKSLSKNLRTYLINWQQHVLKHNEIINSPENKYEMALKEIKRNYDQILNIGTCRSLFGLNPESKDIKKARVTAFDRFSAYHEFYSEALTSKFTKSDISKIKSESKLKNHRNPDIDKSQCDVNNNKNIKNQDIFSQNIQELNGFCLEMDDFDKNSEKRILTISVEDKEKILNEVKKEIIKFKKGLKPKSLAQIWRDSFQDMISRKHLRNIAREGFPEIYKKIWGSEAAKRPSTYRKTDRQHIEDVEQIINEKVGIIIDTFRKKKDTEFYFKIRCAEEHDFDISKSALKRDGWCPKCNKWRPKTDEEHKRDVMNIINAKNGTTLDTYRKKGDTGYYFRIICENRHIFEIRKTELKRGSWCPKCSMWRPKTEEEHITDIQHILDNYEWKIIDTYKKNKDTQFYFTIRCKNGHIFHRSKDNLIKSQNHNCPGCGSDYSQKTIEEHIAEVQEIIKAKEGILIETFYKKSGDRSVLYYKIECKKKHIFNRKKSGLKAGSWCPFCKHGKYEAIILWYFEKILSFVFKKPIKFEKRKSICKALDCKKFVCVLPSEFQHLSINQMHFDGYLLLKIDNQFHNLVVEYQGYHHYHFPNRYHKNTPEGKKAFINSQIRDNFKRWLEDYGSIILFEFPYDIDESMKHPKKIRDFIVSRLRQKLNVNIGRIPEFNHITQSKF